MAALRRLDVPSGSSIWIAKEKKAPKGRGGLTLGWILFLLVGIPFGFMAALGPLAYAGIYIGPLQGLWQPWPPDVVKPFIGVGIFVATLAYLIFRMGQTDGFHWGTVTATAAARNMALSQGMTSDQVAQAMTVTMDPPAPALPPPPSGSPSSDQAPQLEAERIDQLRSL